MLTRICIKMHQDTLRDLDKFAAMRGTTRSKVIRALVASWSAAHEQVEIACVISGDISDVHVDSMPILDTPVKSATPAIEAVWRDVKNNT